MFPTRYYALPPPTQQNTKHQVLLREHVQLPIYWLVKVSSFKYKQKTSKNNFNKVNVTEQTLNEKAVLFQACCSRLVEPTVIVVMLLKAKETADCSQRLLKLLLASFVVFVF